MTNPSPSSTPEFDISDWVLDPQLRDTTGKQEKPNHRGDDVGLGERASNEEQVSFSITNEEDVWAASDTTSFIFNASVNLDSSEWGQQNISHEQTSSNGQSDTSQQQTPGVCAMSPDAGQLATQQGLVGNSPTWQQPEPSPPNWPARHVMAPPYVVPKPQLHPQWQQQQQRDQNPRARCTPQGYYQVHNPPLQWQQSLGIDSSQIRSANRGSQPTSGADRDSEIQNQIPDLRLQPGYQQPGASGGTAGNISAADPYAGMDFDDPNFDWQWFMSGVPTAPSQQDSPQMSPPAPMPYFVGETMVGPQAGAGSLGLDTQMQNNEFGGSDPRPAAIQQQTGHFHHFPRAITHRPRSKGKERATQSAAVSENPECLDCGKRYRTTTSPGRCNRCGAKYERKIAQPRTYHLDPTIPGLVAAKRLIFPPVERRHVQDDDFDYLQVTAREDQYLRRLLDAVNVVQVADGEADSGWKARQQKTFNEKAKLEPGYTNAQVTARLRALFWEAVMFHNGGDASVYAAGGDNAGYPDSIKPFSERFGIICDALENNKRIVMDVVEGRGVQAFVGNPKKYDDRKASNNYCNVKKKKMMDKGKGLEEEESTAAAGRSTTARPTTETRQDTPDSVVSSIETSPAGPGRKRRRTQRRQALVASPPAAAADDGGPTHSADERLAAGLQAPDQLYGSGRSRTSDWVHGGRRDR